MQKNTFINTFYFKTFFCGNHSSSCIDSKPTPLSQQCINALSSRRAYPKHNSRYFITKLFQISMNEGQPTEFNPHTGWKLHDKNMFTPFLVSVEDSVKQSDRKCATLAWKVGRITQWIDKNLFSAILPFI